MFLVTFAFGDRGKVKRYQARTEQLLGVVWVTCELFFVLLQKHYAPH